MKRPFFVIAAGFVLGEACALRMKMAGCGDFAVLAGLILCGLLGLGGAACRWAAGARGKGQKGRGIRLPFFVAGKGVLWFWLAAGLAFLAGSSWAAYRAAGLEAGERWVLAREGRVTLTGELERMERTDSGWELWLKDAAEPGTRGREPGPGRLLVRAETAEPGEDAFGIGMRVQVTGTLKAVQGARNPGEFDYRLYLLSQGITGQVSWAAAKVTDSSGKKPYRDFLARQKRRCSELLGELCGEEDAGLFCSALLGEKKGLDAELRELYQRSGIAHLLAISGLHLSILGMGLYRGLRKLGCPQMAAALAGALAVVSYGVMIGASGSTKRAILMLLCAFLADCVGRTYDLMSALGTAAVLVAGGEPYQIVQSGFQLSFSAVLGISLVGNAMDRFGKALAAKEEGMEEYAKTEKAAGGAWRRRLARWAAGGLMASMAAQIATAPVVLYHFFRFPPYGVLLNLLVIPLMAYVLYSGIAGLVLGSVWLPAGRAAMWAGRGIFSVYEILCRLTERLPAGSVLVGRPGLGAVILYYAAVAAVCAAGRRGKRGAAAALVFCAAAASAGPCLLKPLTASGLTAVFLDVGQGDGIVLENGGAVILVDGGSTDRSSLGENTLIPFFESRGIGAIDCAIVSHGDQDHISGLREMLESGEPEIRRLLLPALGQGQEVYGELEALAESRGAEVSYMKRGDRMRLKGGLALTCLYPDGPEPGERGPKDRNLHSLIILVRYKGFGLLLTGDAEAAGERELAAAGELSPAAVLKAGHHGSESSTSRELLEAVRPSVAVISCGEGNSYGHPHPETLERLEEYQASVWKTQESGAVTVWTDGERMTVEGFLNGGDELFYK